MRTVAIVVLAALGLCSGVAGDTRAETSVRVIATDPPGDSVTLGRNQSC